MLLLDSYLLLFIKRSVLSLHAVVSPIELHWQFVPIGDKLDVLIPLDVLLRQISQLRQRLPVDSDVNDVVILCKLTHALSHSLAVTVAAETDQ